MVEHTKGPVALETVKTSVGVCHKIGQWPTGMEHRPITYACIYDDGTSKWRVLDDGTLDTELLANARRIVALWNAAHGLGLTTEAVEAGALDDLLVCARAALRELSPESCAGMSDTEEEAFGRVESVLSKLGNR